MSKNKDGFTLVELLVVAPIVILVIGGLIGAIIAMTGNVLATRGANLLAYNIQDALNRIETDVRQSGAVLTENNFNLTSPQGSDGGTTKFTTSTSTLVLNTYATDKNPSDENRKIIFKAAGSAPLMMNTVYFVKDNTLWRRIIAQPDYDTLGVGGIKPWQQPSCQPGITGTYCVTKDIRLVDGVESSGFDVKLYAPTDRTNSITDPSTVAGSIEVVITITAKGSVAGRKFTESGTIRAISPNNNASS